VLVDGLRGVGSRHRLVSRFRMILPHIGTERARGIGA
jgi:hypothetical protein